MPASDQTVMRSVARRLRSRVPEITPFFRWTRRRRAPR